MPRHAVDKFVARGEHFGEFHRPAHHTVEGRHIGEIGKGVDAVAVAVIKPVLANRVVLLEHQSICVELAVAVFARIGARAVLR